MARYATFVEGKDLGHQRKAGGRDEDRVLLGGFGVGELKANATHPTISQSMQVSNFASLRQGWREPIPCGEQQPLHFLEYPKKVLGETFQTLRTFCVRMVVTFSGVWINRV